MKLKTCLSGGTELQVPGLAQISLIDGISTLGRRLEMKEFVRRGPVWGFIFPWQIQFVL